MGSLRRYIAAGAVFAWPEDGQPLQEARDRFTVVGNPGVVDSPYGKALDFDGINDYLLLGDSWEFPLRFDAGTQDFSAVVWALHTTTGSYQQLLDKRDGGGDGWGLRVLADETIQFQLDALTASSVATVSIDTWHTFGVSVVRAGNMQIYFDGQASGAPVAVGGEVMATTTNPAIGTRNFGPTNHWSGAIAGVVVFPQALSAEEHAGTHSGGGPF